MERESDDHARRVEEFVLQLFASGTGKPCIAVSEQTEIAALGLDSMALTALIAESEASRGIQFTETQILRLFRASTVRDVIDVMREAHPAT